MGIYNSLKSAFCFCGIPNINPVNGKKKESAPVFPANQSTQSSPAVPPPSVSHRSEAGIRKKLQLQTPPQRKRPSLQIEIPGPLSARPYRAHQPETFIRFNELVNALEDLREIPHDVRTALETSNKASADDGGMSLLATLVRAYSHGGSVTKYAIGEALARLVSRGLLNPVENETDSGYICKTRLQQARQMDPVLDLLMNHLIEQDGDVRSADSPLPRILKESHSVEYMHLCIRSSRRPEVNMAANRAVIEKLKSKQPFSGVHVFQAEHGFDSNEAQILGLFELGLDPKKFWYYPKTGVRPLMPGRLRSRGSHVYDNTYDLRKSRNSAKDHLVKFFDEAFALKDMDIKQQIEQLRRYADGSSGHSKPQVLLVDEGFKVGQALVNLQQSDDPQIREKYALISNLCAMVAHTEGDIIKGKKTLTRAEKDAKTQGRPAPVLPRTINMAQSPAKKLEGFTIGQDVWMATNHLLDMMKEPEAIAQRPKETLLIGYGAIAAKGKPQLQAGHDVWIWDIDPKALLRAYEDDEKQPGSGTGKVHIPVDRATLERVVARGGAQNDEEFVNALAASKKEWFGHGHMVIGNTGATTGCLGADDFALLPDGAILSSGASGDYEFGTASARKNNPHLAHIPATDGCVDFPLAGPGSDSKKVRVALGDQTYFDHQVYETCSETTDPKRFMILRGGYVTNRLRGMPLPFIDIAMATLTQSMYEALQPHNDSRPREGLWLIDPDPDAQNQMIDIANQNLIANNLGTLEDPDFSNADPHWYRPAVPQSPHSNEFSEADGYTSERFVQSGLAACKAYNISPSSFALICDPNINLANSQDLLTLQQEMFPEHETSSKGSMETARPQRTIAHTLYAIFARAATEQNDGIEEEVNAVRTRLGINDSQWEKLLETRDAYGMVPSNYGVLPSFKSAEESDDIQKGRASMQQCISVITINAPTQAQLRGDHERREKIMSDLRTHIGKQPTKEDLIKNLQLIPHPVEGGYFQLTYESALHFDAEKSKRKLLNTIFYMLTDDSPVGYVHRNKSDIVHFYHGGSPVRYKIISPEGHMEEKILGSDVSNGELLHLVVPGGYWKTSQLCHGQYGLISEAVAPGFEYADNEVATMETARSLFPDLMPQIAEYIKPARAATEPNDGIEAEVNAVRTGRGDHGRREKIMSGLQTRIGKQPTKEDLIKNLQLIPHPVEGGYFQLTYESALHFDAEKSKRKLLNTIFYMLTDDSPVGYVHRNKSDIVHFYHGGSPVRYKIISPEGHMEEKILGSDVSNGELLHLVVPGGYWKTSQLCHGQYGLISEAVAPGFEYADNEVATMETAMSLFPDLTPQIAEYIKKTP